MENEPPPGQDGRGSRRDRLMGKLFKNKERSTNKPGDGVSSNNLDSFLHSSADNLAVTHPPPPPPPASLPKLAKLDTSIISRYPQALAVNQQAQQNRAAQGRSEATKSPRPARRQNKKGLSVRFADSYPEVIGEGGDETETPTAEISKRKKSRPPPNPPPHRQESSPGRDMAAMTPKTPNTPSKVARIEDDFQPKPLARTQTGFSTINEPDSDDNVSPDPARTPDQPPMRGQSLHPSGSQAANTLMPGQVGSARFLGASGRHDENRRSFIEIHQAEMREAEGAAFAKAARSASATSAATGADWVDGDRPPSDHAEETSPELSRQRTGESPPEPASAQPFTQYSPAASIHSNASSTYFASGHSPSNSLSQQPSNSLSRQSSSVSQQPRQQPQQPQQSPPPAIPAKLASLKLHDVVVQATDDALNTFVARTRHLFELFRLHAETVRPLQSCPLKDFARAGAWWFLKGRMGLEVTIRERPTSPQSQKQSEMDRQQAYTNLAKSYWLCQEIIPEISKVQGRAADAEINEVSQTLLSALTKLSMSMKRNGFLPPEEAFLPQTIDKAIWLEYPALSQDMIALLSGNWGSGITAMQKPLSTLHLLDAFPIGDTTDTFSYGRVVSDVFLMEKGRESQRLFMPCMLSIVRPQKQTGLIFVLASQDGTLQLAIQENKNAGPTWDDVRWRKENCCLDIRLPRGFMLVAQLSQQDYRMLSSMYEFGAKVKQTLYPRSDEMVVFKNTLPSFQYIDSDPNSRAFPKDAVAQCDVVLFEKIHKEHSPTGIRSWHRGFRIAVVTGPRTRTLSGIHHTYTPAQPIQFGFFRADKDAPALSLKFDNGRSKGRMVLTFSDEKERVKFHSLLTGTALDHDERIFADVPITGFTLAQSLREPLGLSPFSRMPWKAAKVVNEEFNPNGELPPTVLADKLRVVLEYQNGTITDRVNVSPGELRMRLEVTNAKLLRIQRQAQNDVTMSVSEAQVPKELPRNMQDALNLLKMNSTIRTLEFRNLKDLHDFQAALTGYEVVFDALASTFAISRRRMVVPIHKKWEAGYTRIQVVKQEDKVQLLAFFEDFHHGHCMGFVLKGTDVYESCHRSGKPGIKFVDAKFPLPRLPLDKDGDYDDMAFVSLDLPDLPGEHDDITLLFEKETGK